MTGLSARNRATLTAICDAFVPVLEGDERGPLFTMGASALGSPARVEALLTAIRDPDDRAKLRLLLHLLGSPLGNLVFSGTPRAFAALPAARQDRLLRAWSTSSIPLKRAGFQAFKRLALVAHYCWPGTGRRRHPSWDDIGYSGPLAPPAQEVPRLREFAVSRDVALECDVVVVGSGAGGGVVAGTLADAGRDVLVLERGPNAGSKDFTQIEGEMLGSLYLDGGLLMTQDGSIPVLAGGCVGGGTVINYTTAFRLPDATRTEWARRSGVRWFESGVFDEAFDRVSRRLDVGTRWTTPGARDRILERGCEALGWHVGTIPRNVTNCPEGAECGFCGYGCRHGAKNSTARTYLSEAVRAGARLLSNCDVERVLVSHGQATGVIAKARRGGRVHAITVRARRVVVACGAVYTPALLARSGVRNPEIGRNLHLHPATAVVGHFEERVEPWTGALQTRYSEQLADLADGYGVRFETAPVHFALAASGFGWEGSRAHREDVARLAHTGLIGVLLRDRDAGHVAVARSGRPKVHYNLSRYDVAHARAGLLGAARILQAAGATALVSLHTPPARVPTTPSSWETQFMSAMDARGYTKCRMSYIAFHQMGTAAMGRDPRRSVVNEGGRSHEVSGLYVADASVFPTSSGVNPMLTIMAIADHIARRIHAEW